jgi:IMP dehydrogenase/GMP reductase
VCADALIIAGNVATPSGAQLLWEAGADIIRAGIGGGCFAAGTRILMSNATYKNIEDVVAGDRIINCDGKPKTVLDSFSTGMKKVYKLRSSISYKDTFVTEDHKYLVGDLSTVSKKSVSSGGYAKILNTKRSKIKWQEIGKTNRVALLSPRTIEFEMPDSFEIPIFKRSGGNWRPPQRKIDFTIKPSYDVGYMFGLFLGDGHAMVANNGKSNIGCVNWYFGLNEEHITNKLKRCIKNITGRDLKVSTRNNIFLCRLYHKPLSEFLCSFGKKNNKLLPDNLLVNDKEYLQGIHDGLVDSDGNIEKGGRVCFNNTSIRLIELFNIITFILTGCFPNGRKNKISAGGLKNVNIENCHQSYMSRINTSARKRLINNYQVSKLLEFAESNLEVETFDLTIDCDTHSFIADNAIVHNSLCSTRIETGNGYPQLSALKNIKEHPFHSFDKEDLAPPMIIADGGIRSAGDCVKALCFADLVMIGNLFAGTDEAPGDIITVSGQKFKQYVGSSTHKQRHVEGVVGLVPYKGPVQDVVTHLVEGIRSGCSYQGVHNLQDLKKNPEFVVISNAGLIESHPHNVRI